MSRTGRSLDALQRLPRLLRQARRRRSRRPFAELLTQASWLCLQLGQCDAGLEFVTRALDLWGGLDDIGGEALTRAICSWLLDELGLIDEAFVEAEAAVALAEKTDDTDLLAFAYNCKASALALCRQDGVGMPLFERALEMTDAAKNPSAYALYLANIAFSHVSKAELAEAGGRAEEGREHRRRSMDFTRRAIETAEAGGDLWVLRLALCNGAEYAANLGWFDLAQDYLDRCANLPGKTGFRERIHFLYTKGDMLTRLGALSDALPICVEAAALARQGSHADSKTHTLLRLANIEAALGLFEQALEHFRAYHDAYVWHMGEMTRRRAVIAEVQLDAKRLRRQVEDYAHQAAHDPLTGLKNRRKFEEAIAALKGKPYALGILDLDRFKAINDTFSHLVGDAVLQRVAAMLEADAAGWQVYRLGGEEFALLLPRATLEAARDIAEALRQRIAEAQWGDLARGLNVTISLGLAESVGLTASEIMAIADKRLYLAKSRGRNCVVSDDIIDPMSRSA